MKVIFFANGNTACCNDEGQQEPSLQRSYMELYCEFLEEEGIDPAKLEFTFPNGAEAKAFRVGHGWNWEFKKQPKPAIDRLEEFGPYKDFKKRSDIVAKFFKEVKDTAIDKVFDGSLEPAIALLVTFMEWQEKREKRDD